jgi:hypothetical protein
VLRRFVSGVQTLKIWVETRDAAQQKKVLERRAVAGWSLLAGGCIVDRDCWTQFEWVEVGRGWLGMDGWTC